MAASRTALSPAGVHCQIIECCGHTFQPASQVILPRPPTIFTYIRGRNPMRRHHPENESVSDRTLAKSIFRWLGGLKMQAVFDRVYDRNRWHSDESRSGTGSTLEQTQTLIAELPGLFRAWDVYSVLDIPCGDFHWMRHVDLSAIDYLGADVVPRLVEANRSAHSAPGIAFQVLDLVNDPLPRKDLIFCRDCMVHLSFRDGKRALRNMAASGSIYLLATTFTGRESNTNCKTGSWRILNLERPPFGCRRRSCTERRVHRRRRRLRRQVAGSVAAERRCHDRRVGKANWRYVDCCCPHSRDDACTPASRAAGSAHRLIPRASH